MQNYNKIDTTKIYTVLFHDGDEFEIEFTNDYCYYDQLSGDQIYDCWSIVQFNYDKRCMLYVSNYRNDCFIEIFKEDAAVASTKIPIKDLVEYNENRQTAAIRAMKNASEVDN
jgi:hypothetical protein